MIDDVNEPPEQAADRAASDRPRAEPVPQRLHPLTFVLGGLREVLKLAGAGAAGLAVGGVIAAVYFVLAGLVLGLGYHALRWATFSYTVHEDRIELHRSLLGRSVTNIPLERIRGVDVDATPPHRLLRLAVVHIDAGADGGEGTLNAVARSEAERLRRMLLDETPASTTAAPSAGKQERGDVLARTRPRWYVYAPLSGAYLLTPLALIGSAVGTLYNLGDDFGLVDERWLREAGDEVLRQPAATGIALVALVLLAVPLVSVAAYAVTNWNFTLRALDGAGASGPDEAARRTSQPYRRNGAALVAERGLLSRRTVSLERRRVRGVEVDDNPLERLAGVSRLGALVTGLGDAAHRGRLLPTAPRAVVLDLVASVLGARPAPLVAHPVAARTRRVFRAAGPPAVLAALFALTGPRWAAYACAVAVVAAVFLGLDRYRQLGHGTDGARLTVRSGSLRRRQTIVEHGAVVGWRMRRSLFQRRLGLATLVVAIGAGDGACPAVDMAENDAIALAAEITPAWVMPFVTGPAGESSR